jgi:tRNA threonylcarbamoyladenosine biosynthesis protein TsaE
MPELQLDSTSPEQTEGIAAALARALGPGDVVLVAGDVGTGKTTFVRGACRALGVTGTVASPSFAIGRTYLGRLPISHVDLFRLDSLEGEDPALLDDYLSPDAVAFLEWPQAASPQLPPERVALRVDISHRGGDRRRIELRGTAAVLEPLEQGAA